MKILKFFANSFTFKRIFSNREMPYYVVIIYFLIMVLLISFPLSYQYINSGINSFNNITTGIKNNANDELFRQIGIDLQDSSISAKGLKMPLKDTFNYQCKLGDGTEFEIVITNEAYETKANLLLLTEDEIIYYDSNKKALTSNYKRFNKTINFGDFYDNPEIGKEIFCELVDDAFGVFFVAYFVFMNTMINLFMNIALIAIISLILLFIKIKYKKITTYGDNIKIVVSAMTIPALVGMIITFTGLLSLTPFTVVIFQFATPLLALAAIYKGCGEKEVLTKGL